MRLTKRDDPHDALQDCLHTIERSRSQRARLLMEHDRPQPDLTQALLDAAALFDELGIRYALIGGLAAMYYGRARFTEDVDFVAATGHGEVLDRNPDAMRRRRFDPTCTWKLYHDSGAEIDLWKDEHSDAMVARAVPAELAGRSVPIVEVHDLIAMKLRAGRPQDDYDVSEVLRSRRVDEHRIQSLVSAEAFAHYLDIKRRTRGA